MLNNRKIIKVSFIFVFFLILTLLYTYPTILKPAGSIYGITQFHGDPFGILWEIWWYRYAKEESIPTQPLISIIAYPWGWDRAGDPRLPVLEWPIRILSGLLNEAFVYNIIIWSGFVGTALSMYYLINYLIKDRFIGLVGGILFSFCPDHIMHSMQHLGFSLLLWIPLYLQSLFRLFNAPTYKNALFSGLFFSLLLLTNYYYGYFMAVATIVFLLLKFVTRGLTLQKIKILFFAFIFILFFTLPFMYPMVNGILNPKIEVANTYYEQPYSDLIKYAARWQDYFLPSEFHPLLGRWTQGYVKRRWGGRHYFERSLYIGLIPLLFSLVTVIKWRKIRKIYSLSNFFILYFIFLAIVGFIFSLSPIIDIGRLKLPMPSFFMYKLLPMFRVYSRFGILVILSIVVLGCVGIKFIFDKIKDRRWRYIASTGCLILILIETVNSPPFHNIDVTEIPPIYKWLEVQPDDTAVVEYPWVRKVDEKNSDYLFYQRVHRKKLINSAPDGSLGDAFRRQCTDLSSIGTIKLLAYLGANYIILHKDYYTDDYLKAVDENPGLEFIKDFKSQKVYRVVAESDKLAMVYWQNIGSPEKWGDGNLWRWIGNNAAIWIDASNREIIDIEFKILAFAKDRELEVYINDVIAEKTMVVAPPSPDQAAIITLRGVVLKEGGNAIKFVTPQGETKIGDVFGNEDPRKVSFAISNFRIKRQ